MQEFEVVVDFNGIVMFEPSRLEQYFGAIAPGTNLYRRFTQSDDGERVIEQGIVVPVLGLNDSSYRVVVRMSDEPSPIPDDLIIVSNSAFPLHVVNRVVIADLAVLLEWYSDEGWQDVTLHPGHYAVTVRGYRRIENGVVSEFGFEFILDPREALPPFTGSLDTNMQVLELP